MEENQTTLFGMGIDPTTRIHLAEAAKWARFLAIMGFIVCGIIVIVGVFAGSIFSFVTSRYSESGVGFAGMGAIMTVFYLIFGLIYFFPCLFLFRFSSNMKRALASNDQNTLTVSFQNLKIMFRYVGILTIIVLAFYAIIFLFFFITTATMGNYK